ncbi:response regulator transcription factor [Elioraea sp. Yellowstone]|jgi:two-component system OmpR family response regulator|uniref:response regulator transcription factor n=1 Tax=Elioraea sp. Yellowstone TaxID=2592070 RepID=UPI00114DF8A5|nr:response regulator transcription factor [Elioraea sp. Yellowstone]TQF76712.1 response regulator transcription factor [Elioraea sp. Yellowstone]
MKVLVVEDEPELAGELAQALREAGHAVLVAHDGEQGEFLGATETIAAAVLDLGLPKLDGIEVLRRWRGAGLGFPVLILTARDAWSDKVAGFRAGADDYVLKPFRTEEVLLRLATLIRRAAGHAAAEIAAAGLVLDTTTGLVTRDGLPLRLTGFEARILRHLMLHKGRVVGRSELAEHLYDGDADRDFRSLEVLIGRLRRKIGEGRIETVRGEGYRLLPEAPR